MQIVLCGQNQKTLKGVSNISVVDRNGGDDDYDWDAEEDTIWT